MSEKKRIIELAPDGRSKKESFAFTGFSCPFCGGRGSFTEETGKDVINEKPCPYCEGAGGVMCSVMVKWMPQRGE